MASLRSSLQKFLIGLIRIYQWIFSGLVGPCCRLEPHCSAYAIEAIRVFGVLKGLWLIGGRLLRCHPWHPGGVDPIPSITRRGLEHAE